MSVPRDVAGWRSLRLAADGWSVEIVDQTCLPDALVWRRLETLQEVAEAITAMRVRGAPLIGAAAAYGLALAARADPSTTGLERAENRLRATRPTAVNLAAALERVGGTLRALPEAERAGTAYALAAAICEEDVAINRAIGERGAVVLRALAGSRGRPLHVLTHCNAGRLATVGWGTALAPIYRLHADGVPVHVWVTETRPRLQGALTAWELAEAQVPHTVVVDGAAGHLMEHGPVHVCIVGTDRTTAQGDVYNKIGTYPVALAARDHDVPFYVAVPGPSIDWRLAGAQRAPIEERDQREVTHVTGAAAAAGATVRIHPEGSPALNPGFDVTPARLVTGLITERGVCPASRQGLASLYPEMVT